LGDDSQKLTWPRLRQFKSETHNTLDAGPRHDGYIGGRFDRLALMDSPSNARVFPFRVFAYDYPIQIAGGAAFKRGINARQDAGRPNVPMLVEALAYFQPQAPKGDAIGNVGVASRAKKNGVFVA